MTTPMNKADDGVHRLVDMVVEEVSLVDRAANKHRFLIVKRDEAMDDDKTQNTTPAEPSPRLSGLKWEFGGEGEYGAARRAAGSARSGDFGTVLGARGSASVTKRPVRGPRGAVRTAARRRRVNTSPKGRAVRGTTGPGQEEEAQGERGRRGGFGRWRRHRRRPRGHACGRHIFGSG